jgi:hypothetical protein
MAERHQFQWIAERHQLAPGSGLLPEGCAGVISRFQWLASTIVVGVSGRDK